MNSLETLFEKSCNRLLDEEEILFAGIVEKNGKITCGGFKHNVNLLEKEEAEIMFMEQVLMASMNKEFDNCLGMVEYTASKRKLATLISFPMNSALLLIAAKSGIEIEKEANKIQRIIMCVI